jgi:glycosyltransferase involved in cell wall biosynthesis
MGRPVTDSDSRPSGSADGVLMDERPLPLVVATILREEGVTGVHTHMRQLCQYFTGHGMATTMVTSHSWGRMLSVPIFAFRPLILERYHGPASVAWYRYWHEVFLHRALRRDLARRGACVVYAQDPLAARAALRARQGTHQRVILAVHFQTSQADEWAYKDQIKRDGYLFRAIRRYERGTIPRVDGLMYVSQSARNGILSWLPEAAAVPSAIISNFVSAWRREPGQELLGDLVTTGSLLRAKNHRFLLEVLAEASRSGRRLTLDVFGEGPLRQDLLRQARSLGLEEQVRFRGFRTDIRDFLPRYRAYVHASYLDSQSLAIIEAMAAGLPIVAADVGGIAELCDDGVEGRFWSLDDPAGAAAILLELLDDEPARLQAGQAASKRFHRDFDADVIGPRLQSFLMSQPAEPESPSR